jgi:hypothetical protein
MTTAMIAEMGMVVVSCEIACAMIELLFGAAPMELKRELLVPGQ